MLDAMDRYGHAKMEEIQKMQTYSRTYDGPATEFQDEQKSKKIRKRELQAQKELEWAGGEDVEMVCEYFIEYLWGSSKTTLDKLKEERRQKKKIQAEKEDRKRKQE